MKCCEAKRLLRGYLDRELSYNEEVEFKQHLADCPACSDEVGAMEECVALLRNLPETDPGPGFHAAVMEKIRQAEARAFVPDEPVESWLDRLRATLGAGLLRPALVGAISLVAGILIGGGAVRMVLSGGGPTFLAAQPAQTAALSPAAPAQPAVVTTESPISDLALDMHPAASDTSRYESEPEYLLEPYVPDSQRGLVPVGMDRVNVGGEREAQGDAYVTF